MEFVKINTFKFVTMQSFMLNEKNNFGTKIALFMVIALSIYGIFGQKFEKTIVIFLINTFEFSLSLRIEFETKNALS